MTSRKGEEKGKAKLETPPRKNLPLASSPVVNPASDYTILFSAKIRGNLSATSKESIEMAMEPARSAKRNFSRLSATSAEKVPTIKVRKKGDDQVIHPMDRVATLL
jgi:hypothetical protein